MNARDLPDDIKDQLIEIAEKELPTEKAQISFCQSAGKQIAEMAQSFFSRYQYTIVYGAIGSVLGFVVAQGVRAIPVVGSVLGPIADFLPLVFGLKGLWDGNQEDNRRALAKKDEEELLEKIRSIIVKELERAKLAANN